MKMYECTLPQTNRLAFDYLADKQLVRELFDYHYRTKDTYKKRQEELQKRQFPRRELVTHLKQFNKQFAPHEKTLINIEKLTNENSLVVIGGQQAGLLTGPLYTIHKAISIIQLAKKQEKELGIPVIPVFWIAGEDHDFDEINHIFVSDEMKNKKVSISQTQTTKQTMSQMKMDKIKVRKWIDMVLYYFGETNYTNGLADSLYIKIEQSETFVDFFAHLMTELFSKFGLVLVDSGDKDLRKIESSLFNEIITHNPSLQQCVNEQLDYVKALGYEKPIETDKNNAHLFYHHEEQRILLYQNENSEFYGKNNECLFSKKELKNMALYFPEKLSNNVITRPLMQDYLFPTVAFVAGPGEIAYWGILKKAFHLFNMKVPPVVPRLNITFVDRTVEKHLQELNIPLEEVLVHGTKAKKQNWFNQKKQWDVEEVSEKTKQQIDEVHQSFRLLAVDVDPSLKKLAEKNITIIQNQVGFLEKKIHSTIEKRYKNELNKFDAVEMALHPDNGLQERKWNIYYYLNEYGSDLIDRLLEMDYQFNDKHKIIFL
ncbi:bacillithiol biosynthesis cysteine-adding enzyme BshC [Bacillus taeanensis]|nr:bacillithiol biosynthesis cysteine-adding enzyme BshC [Bacillus taeanensis]